MQQTPRLDAAEKAGSLLAGSFKERLVRLCARDNIATLAVDAGRRFADEHGLAIVYGVAIEDAVSGVVQPVPEAH